MESIKKPLGCILLPLLILLLLFYGGKRILFERFEYGAVIMKNFTADSISFDIETDRFYIDDSLFLGKNETAPMNYKDIDGCSSAVLLTNQDAAKVGAIIEYAANYFFSEALNDSTIKTDYKVIEIDSLCYKYYYCGNLSLHPGIESYIILKTTDKQIFNNGQSLWLFNVKKGRLSSVSELFIVHHTPFSSYRDYEGSFRDNNIFIYFEVNDREEIQKIQERFFNSQSLNKKKRRFKNTECELYVVNADGYIEIIKPAVFYRPRYDWMSGNVSN